MGSGGSHGGAGGGGGGAQNLAGGGAGGPVEQVPSTPGNWAADKYPSDPVTNPGGQLTGPGVKAEQLSASDAAPIIAYTGGKVPGGERFKGLSAEKLNRSLYDPEGFKRTLELAGESPSSIADYMRRATQYKNELNAAMDKLRNYEGEVYRTISDHGGSLAAKYEVGKPVTFKEFVSTSRSTAPTYKAFDYASTGDTRFVIQSKTGKWIESISNYTGEREVLFKSGSKFMVTKKTFNKDRGTWDIHMKEI